MPPIGAGLSPAGSAAAGYGVPDVGTQLPSAILPDVRTGGFQTGRLINPVTKDYVMQANGTLQGFDTVPQLVQLALSTQLGSSALLDLGIDLANATEKGSDFQRQMATLVANALSPLIGQKLVRLDAVIVQEPPSNPDAGIAIVKWFDLTTETQNTSTVGI
jgi:hypothetical protein